MNIYSEPYIYSFTTISASPYLKEWSVFEEVSRSESVTPLAASENVLLNKQNKLQLPRFSHLCLAFLSVSVFFTFTFHFNHCLLHVALELIVRIYTAATLMYRV